ncbi:MAG: hypothetical protein Q4F67_08805 [Propionibacteriaceae bacterium]|nr:hypothetical protein [Propionibacteriaceae bacterium]
MSFVVRFDWGDGGDIQSPELQATWGELRIEIAGQPVTAVQAASGGARTSVNVSAYPLAEWFVENWFAIFEFQHADDRPETPATNLRRAGEGMCWPDLLLAAEGDVVLCEWSSGRSTWRSPTFSWCRS